MPNNVKRRLMRQPDKKLGYKMLPGYECEFRTSEFDILIKINSNGFRDYEYHKDKGSTTFRILVLGDSFTFGIGVDMEETYPKLLEKMLNRHLGEKGPQKYEVINAGADGYGTEQEYLYLENLGNQYRPDLVIIGLYSNDVTDVMKGISSDYTRTWLKNNFYFLSYIRGLQRGLIKIIFNRKIHKHLFQIYGDKYTPQFENALSETKEYIVKIRDLSSVIGAKTLLVIIPQCFETNRTEWEKRGIGDSYNDEFFNNNMLKYSNTFTEFGKRKGIPTLPLLPVFRKSKITPLYLLHDSHWNKHGHELGALSIYNFIKENGLCNTH